MPSVLFFCPATVAQAAHSRQCQARLPSQGWDCGAGAANLIDNPLSNHALALVSATLPACLAGWMRLAASCECGGLAVEFLVYLVLGGFAGTLAGLFGVGGGMIIVPVLVYSFTLQGFAPEVLTHMAVGTSLATIAFTSINAIRAHHLKGAVRWLLFVWLTVGIVFGSVLGALTAALIQGPGLQKIIGVFAIAVAIQMAFDLRPKATSSVPSRPTLGIAGGVIGWASAIFGIGGGSLTGPFLVWPVSPLPEWSLGYIYLPAMVGIAATSMLFAGFGARLAHRLSQQLLKRLFALLLLGVGINFLM